MTNNWGYQEELLKLLAKASLQPKHSKEQTTLLNEAGILLWRFDHKVFPLTANDILPLLHNDVESWLPKNILFNFKGPLLSQDKPTSLVNNILIDMSGIALFDRDKLIDDAIQSESARGSKITCFRELFNSYDFRGVINRNAMIPSHIKDIFYEDIPDNYHNDFIQMCAKCGYPLEQRDVLFSCPSPYCSNSVFDLAYPHQPIPFKKHVSRPSRYKFSNQLKLKHIIWRTITCPMLMEAHVLQSLKKSMPENSTPSLNYCQHAPGVSLTDGTQSISFEPTIINHPPSVVSYYSAKIPVNQTWIVVPRGLSRFFKIAKFRLGENYNITTTHSFRKEYLFKYHNIGVRVEPWKIKTERTRTEKQLN